MNPHSLVSPIFDDPFYFFVHSEKTGGLTLNGILVTKFQEKQIFTGDLHSLLEADDVDQKPCIKTAGYRYTRAHFPIFPFRFDRDVVYLTMLRDPIQRTLSLYRQDVRGLSLEGSEVPTLKEWLMQDERSWNAQTRLLSGNWIDARDARNVQALLEHPDQPLTNEKMLALARKNLAEHFHFFGITEQFGDSLRLLQAIFPFFSVGHYRSFNRNSQKPGLILEPSDLAAVQRNNSLDLDLYSYALQLFNECRKVLISRNENPEDREEARGNENVSVSGPHERKGAFPIATDPAKPFLLKILTPKPKIPETKMSIRGELLVSFLNQLDPAWKKKKIHEFNPQLSRILPPVRRYQVSYFHWDDTDRLTRKGKIRKLGELRIPDHTLDYFIAVDAMDFVRVHQPIFGEVLRTLRHRGKFLFTLSISKTVEKTYRRVIFMPDRPEPIYAPKYQRGALGGELLVAWEFGLDYSELLSQWIHPYRYQLFSDPRYVFEENFYIAVVVMKDDGTGIGNTDSHDR